MHPINFGNFNYVPILGVRPAEMTAYEELSATVKENILPFIVLQPWSTANELVSATTRIDTAVGSNNPVILDLIEQVSYSGSRRPVHDSMDQLMDSSSGFMNWVRFIEDNQAYIPTLQLADPDQVRAQIAAFSALNRGLVVRLSELQMSFAGQLASMLSGSIPEDQLLFILDFQAANRDILNKLMTAITTARNIRGSLQNCFIAISASSFPSSFTDIVEQEIYERQFYNHFVAEIGTNATIYSDRGSARAESLRGGSGSPAPRIDLPLENNWKFFREPDEDDPYAGYQLAAQNTMRSSSWVDLGIWGTERIKETASADSGINTSTKSTAARINIHLHMQAGGGIQPDEIEWSD